jgi:hypothetical protein
MPNADTKLIRPKSDVAADLEVQISAGRDILRLDMNNGASLDHAESTWKAWHARNKLIIGKAFSDGSALREYLPMMFGTGTNFTSRGTAVHQNVGMLLEHLLTLSANLDLVDEVSPVADGASVSSVGSEIFIVHGHAHRDAVALVVERSTRREAIVLQEMPDVGSSTVIEKLEREAQRAGYAVVILSGDDEGKLRTSSSEPQPRARQNVIAELGYFIGRLGRSKVKALYEPGVELPSDFGGVTYIELDDGDAWRRKLADELHAMGL